MHKKSLFYIILAGVFWGTSSIFVSRLRPYGFSSLQITSARNIVAALVMLVYALSTNPKGMKVPLKEIGLFALSGVAVFATSVSYFVAMKETTPATAVVLMYSAPIFVMIVSVLFMNEKFTKGKLLAVILTFAGCGLVSGIVGGIKLSLSGFSVGILAGIMYAIYNILAKIVMRRGNNAVIATTYCFVTAGIMGLLLGNPAEMAEYISQEPPRILALIVGIGACTGAVPYFLYTLASKKLPASVASAMSSIEPMTAALVSFFGLGVAKEPFSIQSGIGIAAIIIAVIILSKSDDEDA